jgi:hypothetical protein
LAFCRSRLEFFSHIKEPTPSSRLPCTHADGFAGAKDASVIGMTAPKFLSLA